MQTYEYFSCLGLAWPGGCTTHRATLVFSLLSIKLLKQRDQAVRLHHLTSHTTGEMLNPRLSSDVILSEKECSLEECWCWRWWSWWEE